MPFDFLKKKKDDPKGSLTATQKLLTNPFVSKAIDFISAGQTLPEAEAEAKRQKEMISKIPDITRVVRGLDMLALARPKETLEDLGPAAVGVVANLSRVPTAIQTALFPKPGKTRAESAIEGLIRPDLTPPGFLGGEIRKKFPAPVKEEGLLTPSNITAALLGTAGELASFEAGTGTLPGRLKRVGQTLKTRGAFKSGEELVDKVTRDIILKRDPKIVGKGKALTAEMNNLRPKVRKAILGSEKPEEILRPEVAEKLLKKQTPKKLATDWIKSVKKILGEETGAKRIISPKEIKDVVIPKFKSTEEAVEFGKKATPLVLNALKSAKATQDKVTDKIQAIEKPSLEQMQQGIDEATKGQLLREAIESAEGKIGKEIKEAPKVTPEIPTAEVPPVEPPTKPPIAEGAPEIPEPPEIKPVAPKKVKGIVREVTGQKDVSEPIKITEKQALKRELKEEAKAATAGLREGKKLGFEEGKIKVREVLEPKLAKQELKMQERFEKLKRDKELGLLKEDIRRRQELTKLEERFKAKEVRTKERQALSTEVKSLIKNIKTKPVKDLPIEYKDAIEDIKQNIDFEKVKLSNILKREKANKILEEDIRATAKELSAINAEDMTLADLQEVDDIVSQIHHSGVHQRRFLNNEIKIEHDKAIVKAADQLKPTKVKKTELPLEKILNEETLASRTKRVAKQYLYENRRPEAIFNELDNFKEGGAFTEVAWKPTIKGTYKYQTSLDNFIDSVKGITQKIKGKNVGEKKIKIPGIKRKISIADAMGVYAHSQNPTNKAHLIAMGFNNEQIQSVINQLDPKFKSVVNNVIDFLSKDLFPKIDATNVKLKGTHLGKVDRYFPIMNLLDVGSVDAVKMDLQARQQYRRSGIAKSFTKQREVADQTTKAFKKIDFFSTLYQHLNNAAYYINMSEPIRDASKFLFDPNVRQAIRDSKGDALNRINRKWIDDISSNRLPTPTNTFETVVDVIGKNAVMYFIGSSLSVAMKQPASFMQGAGMIAKENKSSGAEAFNGLLQVTTNPMAVLRFASNRSPLVRNRVKMFSQERDFQEIFAGRSAAGKLGAKDVDLAKRARAFRQTAAEASMMPIQIMDMTTVLSIWKGDYDAQIAKGIDPKKAAEHADMVIRRTQPMGGIINLPETFRGNVTMRQITRLKNQPSQNVNLMLDSMKKFARSKKEISDIKEFGKDAFWWFLGPAVLWGMLSRKRLPRDKKEVSSDLMNFGLGGLPIISQAISAYTTPYYDSDLLNSFLSKIKGIKGGRTEEKRLKSTIEAAGIGAGIPGGASIARLYFGKDLQQKILGGESQATRMKFEYMDALKIKDKKERIARIKEVNRKVKKKGLSVSKISKDGKAWLRNDLREKYKIEGNIDSKENLSKIRKMPKDERGMLIRSYSSSTQEKLREKL